MKLNGSITSWLVLFLTLPVLAIAQIETVRFEILPGSQYTYIPSAASPPAGVDGCSAGADGDLRCDFEIAGLFNLRVDPNGPTRITDADLSLSGNQAIAGQALTTSAGVEQFLEDLILVSAPSPTTTAAFNTPLLSGPIDPISLVIDTPGSGGSLSGGFREVFVFSFVPGSTGLPSNLGEGIEFQVNLQQVTVSVPEPNSLTIIGFTVTIAGLRRRRK